MTPMINLVTVCHQSYYSIIDYIPYVAHYILMTYLFYNLKLIYLLFPFTDFTYPTPLPLW